MRGHIVTDVTWRRRLTGVRIAPWSGDIAATIHNTIRIDCDLLAMSGGWSPAVHLHSQSGGKNVWDETLQCFVPGESVQECISAGAGQGVWSLKACLQSGLTAGIESVARCGLNVETIALPKTPDASGNALEPLWRVPASKDADRCPKQFLDFQTDACVADVRLAVREGYNGIEHVKRYTALGFGTMR